MSGLTGGAMPADAQAQAAATPPPAAAKTPGPDYVIGPGDTLQIFVWRSPELSTTVPVRPDGKISTPLVEDMTVVGKTPAQLARDMEQVLGEYVRSPKVNVLVTAAVSTLSQVKVIGQVKNPQSVAFRSGLRVLDVVLQVGGPTDFAAPNRAKIVRSQNGKSEQIKVKVGNLIGGDMSQNLALMPGDVLVIPESRF